MSDIYAFIEVPCHLLKLEVGKKYITCPSPRIEWPVTFQECNEKYSVWVDCAGDTQYRSPSLRVRFPVHSLEHLKSLVEEL